MTIPAYDTAFYAWTPQQAAALRITAMEALQGWAAPWVAPQEEHP